MLITIQQDTCIPMFIAAVFYNSQDGEATQVSINWWMNKEVVCVCINVCMYVYDGILLSYKKSGMLPFATKDWARKYNAKCSKSEKDTVWFHSCRIQETTKGEKK